MSYAFVIVAVLVIIGLVALYALRKQGSFVKHHNEVHRELVSDRTPTLEYDVPVGQDPAVILAALEIEGYTATVQSSHPLQRLLIACAGDRETERARIRSTIESAGVTTPHDHAPVHRETVRFADE